ncbi:probable methyltransferase PMT24 [Tanacetum coccineum]
MQVQRLQLQWALLEQRVRVRRNVDLQACLHKILVDPSVRGSNWPKMWPEMLDSPPYWLKSTEIGVYRKPAPKDFADDYKHWKNVATKSYLKGLGVDWSSVRNVMDMRSTYGGFDVALRALKVGMGESMEGEILIREDMMFSTLIIFSQELRKGFILKRRYVAASLQTVPKFQRSPDDCCKTWNCFVEFDDDNQSSVAMQSLQGFKITPQNSMAISYAKK